MSEDIQNENILSVECTYYDENRDKLLLQYPNRYLLIFGDRVIGNYAKDDDAIYEGCRQFGDKPFLVRRSGDTAPELNAPALALGILKCQQP